MAGVRSAGKEALGHALTCCPDTDTLYHLLPDKPQANKEDSVQFRFFHEVRSCSALPQLTSCGFGQV